MYTTEYFDQHLPGFTPSRLQQVVDSMWVLKHFLPESPMNELFKDITFEEQQDLTFRASINLPPLGEALTTIRHRFAPAKGKVPQRRMYKLSDPRPLPSFRIHKAVAHHDLTSNNTSRISSSGRVRKLPQTHTRGLSRRHIKAINNNRLLTAIVLAKPDLGPYENDHDCTTYFPFPLQHSILTTLQDLIEESLFSFASLHFPQYLAVLSKTIPKAIELNTWRFYLDQNVKAIRANLAPDFVLEDLYYFHHRLCTPRHLAVHRRDGVPIEAINSMCVDGIGLARVLGDPRAVLLGFIQERVLTHGKTLLNISTPSAPFNPSSTGSDSVKTMLKTFRHAISTSKLPADSSEAMKLWQERFPEIMQIIRALGAQKEKEATPTPAHNHENANICSRCLGSISENASNNVESGEYNWLRLQFRDLLLGKFD